MRTRHPRSAAAGAAALAVVLLAGCGTTVSGLPSGAGSQFGANSSGLGVPGSTAAGGSGPGSVSGANPGLGGTPGGVGGAGAGAAGGTAGIGGTATAAGGTTTGGQAASGGSSAATTGLPPGVTSKTVNVGIVYTGGSSDNVGKAYGASNLVYGNLRAEQEAVINYINAHGGVAGGRKLHPIEYNAGQSLNAQAMCSYWTEDNKVFAGVYPGGQVESDVAVNCLQQHHAIFVTTPFDPGSESFMNAHAPYYYVPSGLESVRMGRDYVDGLAAQGFFSGVHKVGLLYYQVPSLEAAYAQGVKPALAAHGVKLTSAYGITYPYSDSQDGSAVSAVDNAELKMRAQGVDRVMFLDAGAGLVYFFSRQAQTQGYHPRYGLESGSNPAFVDQQQAIQSQLVGAVGVGWLPTGDVDTPYVPDSPARSLCRKIEVAAGQRPQSESDLYAQYDMCASFFFLADALNRMKSFSVAGFQTAAEGLRSSPASSAASFGESYGPGKHWGAGYYRDLAFTASCRCFKYVGSPHRA